MSKHSVRTLTLTIIMLATLPSYAGQFLQPFSIPGDVGAKAVLTGDFNGDGHTTTSYSPTLISPRSAFSSATVTERCSP